MNFKTVGKYHLVRFGEGTALVSTVREAWALIFKLREVSKR